MHVVSDVEKLKTKLYKLIDPWPPELGQRHLGADPQRQGQRGQGSGLLGFFLPSLKSRQGDIWVGDRTTRLSRQQARQANVEFGLPLWRGAPREIKLLRNPDTAALLPGYTGPISAPPRHHRILPIQLTRSPSEAERYTSPLHHDTELCRADKPPAPVRHGPAESPTHPASPKLENSS